jgi:hypothetical protein
MSRKKVQSKAALIKALREFRGNMASVGRHFGVSRSCIWGHVDADPELRAICEEESESFIDSAESKLFEAIDAGNVAATIFFLKTKGRERGYSERLEIMPMAQLQIEVELGAPTNSIENEDRNTEALNGNRAAVALLEQ